MGRSPADELRALTPARQQRAIARVEADLGPEGVAALEREWKGFFAREEQLAPVDEDWHTLLFVGDFGVGKTTAAANVFLEEFFTAPYPPNPRIVVATGASVESTVGEELKRWVPHDIALRFASSKGHVGDYWIGDRKAMCTSADAPAQNVGEGSGLHWLDDPAKWVLAVGAERAEQTWRSSARSLRVGRARRIISTTAAGVGFVVDMLRGEMRGVIIRDLGKVENNRGNLNRKFIANTVADQRARGEWDQTPGESPFRDFPFNERRSPQRPRMKRLGVGIDPATSTATYSCEVGIVGGGQGEGSVTHVRANRTAVLSASPPGWPGAAWDLLEELMREFPEVPFEDVFFKVETNKGGNEPAALLRHEEIRRRLERGQPGNSTVKIVEVRSEKSKTARAELPARLGLGAAQQLLFSLGDDDEARGRMRALETQLRNLRDGGSKSDGADACVHLVVELAGLSEASEDTGADQFAIARAMNETLSGKRPKEAPPEPGPMKVEGAPPGDARHPGPAKLAARTPNWRARSVF